jgi:hypothetical protein
VHWFQAKHEISRSGGIEKLWRQDPMPADDLTPGLCRAASSRSRSAKLSVTGFQARAPRATEANRFWRQSSRIKSGKVLGWPPGMLGEQIVIVDPRSMEIVAIIDA